MSEETVATNGVDDVRDVPGLPGYRVGTDGSVWSCRAPDGSLTERWHRLKVRPRKGKHGHPYRVVSLRAERNGRLRNYYVHRLVLEAFVGPCPPGMEGLHGDGDVGNNRLDNLRWGTPQDNADDALAHGTRYTPKLSPEVVQQIHELRAGGIGPYRIARLVGVHPSTVKRVSDGSLWRHLHPEGTALCYAVIDIAPRGRDGSAGDPLAYSATARRVLAVCGTRDQAQTAMEAAWDQSGFQQLRVVDVAAPAHMAALRQALPTVPRE